MKEFISLLLSVLFPFEGMKLSVCYPTDEENGMIFKHPTTFIKKKSVEEE